MSAYVIGDVQGCFATLMSLLKSIEFDPKADKLIFLGDTINRGPQSLEVLRLLYTNQNSMSMVLGNHELYAIALSLNAVKPREHTLANVFAAPDADELFNFLRHQPFMSELGHDHFVHAGILPAWSLDEAHGYARELSQILISSEAKTFLLEFYEHTPKKLKTDLSHHDLLKLSLASFVFIRMCKKPHKMNFSYSGGLDKEVPGLTPWFKLRSDGENSIFFGHWAAIGYLRYHNYYALDAGCVWGKQLCALRLDDRQVFLVDNCES